MLIYYNCSFIIVINLLYLLIYYICYICLYIIYVHIWKLWYWIEKKNCMYNNCSFFIFLPAQYEGDESAELKMLRNKVARMESDLDQRNNSIDELRGQLINSRANDDQKERLQVNKITIWKLNFKIILFKITIWKLLLYNTIQFISELAWIIQTYILSATCKITKYS